ncbi:MAG: helix-turn-helix domain-containing protein [Thermoanaerobaculum sp.]|nr:helix-turn-helix domain-containing protein [Thermoanaerobaculum sp.]
MAERAVSPSLTDMASAMDVVLQGMLDRGLSFEQAVRTFEECYARAAIQRHGGSIQRAAAALQVHRNTLRAKLRRGPRPTP